MMRLLSLSPKARQYASVTRIESKSMPGVSFTIRRMSLGRRIELARLVRELLARLEFHQAGAALGDKVEAAVAAGEIEAIYLRWGLVCVEGLDVDGESAGCEQVIAVAPECLASEVVSAIKAECGLNEQERKN